MEEYHALLDKLEKDVAIVKNKVQSGRESFESTDTLEPQDGV